MPFAETSRLFVPAIQDNHLFHEKRAHQVNTSQTMSTEVKNKFQAIWSQNNYFRSKPSQSGQYESNHVDQGKK